MTLNLCKMNENEKIILKIDDSKFNTIAIDAFGMDALTFNQAEL